MDFQLNDEEAMLWAMVSRLFEREHDPHIRRLRLTSADTRTDALWPRLAELGVLGICLPASHGGMGLSTHDAAIATHLVARAMGRVLATAPFVANCVVAAPLLAELGASHHSAALSSQLASGQLRVVLAHAEGGPDLHLSRIQTQAAARPEGYRLNGRKLGVIDGNSADYFIVAARTETTADEDVGVTLFLLDRAAPGLNIRSHTGFDGGDLVELILDDVDIPAEALLGRLHHGLAPMRHAVQRGMAALISEAHGAMERLMELCIDHLKTRQQFGQALSKFQALQHHIARMATALEQVHSMALVATAACSMPDEAARSRTLSAAKALSGNKSLEVAKLAVQLHGGMGMTDELLVGHYFRRLITINATWGSAEAHMQQYADTML